jgi:hypothetical protein
MSPWWRRDKNVRVRVPVDADLDIGLETPEFPLAGPPQAEALFDADEYIEEWSAPTVEAAALEVPAADVEGASAADVEDEPAAVAGPGSKAAARLGLFERLFSGSRSDGVDVPSADMVPADSELPVEPIGPDFPDEAGPADVALLPVEALVPAPEKEVAPAPGPGPEEHTTPAPAEEPVAVPVDGTVVAAVPVTDLVDDDEMVAVTSRGRHVRRRKFGHARRGPSPKVAGDHLDETVEQPDSASIAAVAEATMDDPVPRKQPSELAGRIRGAAIVFGKRALAVCLIVVLLMASLFGLTLGVNALARWNAKRIAALNAAPSSPAEDNLLVIGVSDGVAVGFTALKAERSSKRVLGIAIPDGAFMEVPGQGFERVGASFVGGADVSKDAVSNYLGVPFRNYVVMDGAAYQAMLKGQTVNGIMSGVRSTDLNADQRSALTEYFATVNTKDVWIVPLPVKPVAVGDQRYFEPQRAQVADLLLQWWGVQPGQQKATPRVIVYNGVGTPGLAGLASQQLIRAGLRVVDSGNADDFKHQTTLILIYHGTQADAEAVKNAIGVGQILVQSAPQELTDMIVIIGSDYRPPTTDASTVPTGGVQ